jgi:hypothetical protein
VRANSVGAGTAAGGALVNIERAEFNNGTDVDLVAQQFNVALRTRMVSG